MSQSEAAASAHDRQPGPVVMILTGMSGAGRSTAIAAFEDMGYESVDNFPLGL
ncbi:MAG: RNase adapter RapZ, partial [Pseudomonadota bacterium]